MKTADHISGIQAALGMGNDIDFFTPGFLYDLQNLFLQDLSVSLYRPPCFLMTIINAGSITY